MFIFENAKFVFLRVNIFIQKGINFLITSFGCGGMSSSYVDGLICLVGINEVDVAQELFLVLRRVLSFCKDEAFSAVVKL